MTVYEMSVSASFLILAIVVIRALAIHKLPKVTFSVLWGVAVCRLLIPFSLTSSFSIYAAFDRLNSLLPEQSSTSVASLQQITTIQQIINPTKQATTAVWTSPVLIVWVIGLLACVLFFLITHFRCRREYKTALPIGNRLIAQWLQSHKTVRPVQIRQLDRINAPLTYGILRPVILLPKVMDRTDEKQLQYVLTHEFVHIKRFDTFWKWLLAAILCIHWFNPIVWVMYILANRDIELSCDEAVVRAFGATQKSSYAHTLISMEERRSIYAPLCNNFSKNAIEERINAIMKLKKISIVGIVAALVLVIGVGIAFATTGSNKPGNNSRQISAAPVQNSPNINTTELSGNAKSVSDAKSLIKSITEGSMDSKNHISASPSDQSKGYYYRSFVIKFKQDMDASTLNSQNIRAYVNKNSTEINCNYNDKSRELQIDIKLDNKQNQQSVVAWNPSVQVILTKNIKTADGKFLVWMYTKVMLMPTSLYFVHRWSESWNWLICLLCVRT